jgi:hypothetical protein
MGMFSEVINQCPTLGGDFSGVLQTKDLECVMDWYWLAPDGGLYRIDDSGTWTLEFEEGRSNPLTMFKRVPTGLKGRVRPYRKFGTVRFTARAQSGEYLESVVWFEDGALQRVLCQGPIFSCERVDGEGGRP